MILIQQKYEWNHKKVIFGGWVGVGDVGNIINTADEHSEKWSVHSLSATGVN